MVQNVAGLDDPKRSSDGGAVSIFDHSSPLVAGNVIAANLRARLQRWWYFRRAAAFGADPEQSHRGQRF